MSYGLHSTASCSSIYDCACFTHTHCTVFAPVQILPLRPGLRSSLVLFFERGRNREQMIKQLKQMSLAIFIVHEITLRLAYQGGGWNGLDM